MTRAATNPRAPRENPDPYGIGPVSGLVGPILAVIGLLVIGWLTLALLTGNLPVPTNVIGGGGGNNGAGRTPAPSNVVVVDPRADVPGSIVYVKAGNVWIQSGTTVRQLTRSGQASDPSWSPDGQWIYYIETAEERGLFPARGVERRYTMQVPSLMRMRADGTSDPEVITRGLIETGRYTWFHWIREPVLSPDGRSIAVVSDGPDPTRSNVVLQIWDVADGTFSRPNVRENEPLGHQDPTWRPDGKLLLVVRNGRATGSSRGAPVIVRWNPETGRSSDLSAPGYLAPSWSRDLRWVAATRTTNLGTDVVVLDARTGAEVFRVTNDGRSFSPVWSPMGDSIAYLHSEGGIVDLRLAKLGGTAPAWQVSETINLTEVSALQATSRPGWFIPPDQLPPLPTPVPSRSPGASGAATPAASGAASP